MACLCSAWLRPSFPHEYTIYTYGSLTLSKGAPLEVVSERLGHANFITTRNLYRHVLENERFSHLFDLEEMIKKEQKPEK